MPKKLSHPYAYDRKPRFTHEHRKYAHGHLYYLVSVVSFALFIFCVVQGVLAHTFKTNVQDTSLALFFALLLYLIGALFLCISIQTYYRGRGHYPY